MEKHPGPGIDAIAAAPPSGAQVNRRQTHRGGVETGQEAVPIRPENRLVGGVRIALGIFQKTDIPALGSGNIDKLLQGPAVCNGGTPAAKPSPKQKW
ncbi:MAG TPA: hypothetical protein PLG66_03910, partial [Calditrichia bacterium]|nr:hypothetical protein [Calditrichia bacterium]